MATTTVQPQAQSPNTPPSPTNGRHSLTSTITSPFVALGARISRTISGSGSGTVVDHQDGASVKSGTAASGTYYAPEVGLTDVERDARSRSRGRELFSTGRGGAGNIHRSASASRGSPHPGLDTDVHSPVRGRDPISNQERLTHVGRGGAGNIRSPSRDPVDYAKEQALAEREREIIREADSQVRAVSTGRGGVGNIATDRSRSRGPDARSASRGRTPGLHSSGRGGAGNITGEIARLDEEDLERLEHRPKEHVHSTGRGGLANITEKETPGVEGVPHTSGHAEGEYVSQGRGGAGNIHARSPSREPKGSGGPLHGLAEKVHNLHLGGHRNSVESTAKE